MKNICEIIKKAQKNKYAVIQFNIHTLVNMKAAIEAAVKCNAPVVIACTKPSFDFAGMQTIIACFQSFEKQYPTIPMILHMDHYSNFSDIKKGIDLGIKSVMIDASKLSFTENIKLTRQVVNYAHARGVSVEAEIGEVGDVQIGHITDNQQSKNAKTTTPKQIMKFVNETNVDLLAVGIGNIHGKYLKTPILHPEILINAKILTNVPFVLHGASGLSDKQLQNCIDAGCHKINIGTELKTPFVSALKSWFNSNPDGNDPRLFLQKAINEIKCSATKILRLSGSCQTT